MSEKEMEDLLAIVERALGKSWIDIVDWLRETNSLDEIDARLQAGDIAGAVRSVEAAAERYAADIHAGYVTAGQRTAKWLDELVANPVRFDPTNDRAQAWADKNAATLARGMTQEQVQTIRTVVSDGVRDGRNPRELARDIRGSIGLTPSQANAVQSYRHALETQDYSNALDRQLSSGHSDRTIAAARDAQRTMTPEQVDAAVERYRANYVNYRAQVIARTEALRAVHSGNEELLRQAVDRGDVDADSLTRTWNAAHDGRTRASHRAMDRQSRAFGESFTTGDGVDIAYPGDPSAPIEETAQCRCTLSTRVAA